MNAISPTDSMAQSKFFLQLLDPATTRFCFRTFDDKKGAERTGLLSKRDGTVGQHTAQLRELNDAEAGIYVVVNEGGQTDNDITRVRAVFADIDNVDIPYEPIAEALTPHCVIESSPGKHHIYWLAPDEWLVVTEHDLKPIVQKISPKIDLMKQKISTICKIKIADVGITATSGEGLTAFGRGEGIQAITIITVSKS